MRWPLKSVWVFAAGLLVGALAAVLPTWRHWQGSFEDWYVLGVADQAAVANQILAGRGRELALANVERFPEYVRALEALDVDSGARNAALWLIRDAYEQAQVAPAPEIAARLRDLPPREQCKLPLRRSP